MGGSETVRPSLSAPLIHGGAETKGGGGGSFYLIVQFLTIFKAARSVVKVQSQCRSLRSAALYIFIFHRT